MPAGFKWRQSNTVPFPSSTGITHERCRSNTGSRDDRNRLAQLATVLADRSPVKAHYQPVSNGANHTWAHFHEARAPHTGTADQTRAPVATGTASRSSQRVGRPLSGACFSPASFKLRHTFLSEPPRCPPRHTWRRAPPIHGPERSPGGLGTLYGGSMPARARPQRALSRAFNHECSL